MNYSDLYFNSTMVRLKASSETRISGLELFQFHYGTIKSGIDGDTNYADQISIPLWYD